VIVAFCPRRDALPILLTGKHAPWWQKEHLALTTREAVARLKQNWTDDVAAFDAIFTQAMSMADALTDGIAKQFPTKVA
jgi:hypothetical protein